MKKTNYVATTLSSYLNESNRSIMLTRKYGESEPVVVGSRAPLRNQVLSFVAENVKVTRPALKKFIAGLNETTSNPAATNMWLKRNEKFFIVENKAGIVSYKLSKLGERLLNTITPMSESKKEVPMKGKTTKKLDPKKHLLLDEDDTDDEEKVHESREERIERIIEGIKAKRKASKLFEAEDEETEEETEEEETEEEETEEEETEEETEEGEEETEDDDRVEITEFVISVDDVQAAIAELAELGIDAAEVGLDDSSEFDMEASDDLDGEEEMDDLGSEEETDEMGDFDLDIEGELGGEDETGNELEEAEVEDELTSDDDEFTMGDLDSSEGDDLGGDVEGEMDDLSGEDEMADDLGGEEAPVVAGGSQIKVSADNWEKLKGWLESKGVDIEEMFGGQIETEGGEEGIEDEINFDQLEEMPDDESKKHEESESEEEAEEQEEGDDEKGEEKPNGGFEPGKKGVNPFPKK